MYIGCTANINDVYIHIYIRPVEGWSTVTTIHLEVHKPWNLNHGKSLARKINIMIPSSLSTQEIHNYSTRNN